jgi:hypothetical protein
VRPGHNALIQQHKLYTPPPSDKATIARQERTRVPHGTRAIRSGQTIELGTGKTDDNDQEHNHHETFGPNRPLQPPPRLAKNQLQLPSAGTNMATSGEDDMATDNGVPYLVQVVVGLATDRF